MRFFEHKGWWFTSLCISVLLIFFLFRPLNSPQYRIIVADGLGYYAYLPAKFIYHDQQLNFYWFDEVFARHYDNHVFERPTQNFMVPYGDRQINLYYPGQSLLQLPFFLVSHAVALLFSQQADGFSQPYQIGMGLCAIFYTMLGLFFCSKLVFRMSGNRVISALVPLIIFFSTNLFTYTIFNGCYTHCYSFCFISMAYYFAFRFFNEEENNMRYLLLFGMCALVVVFLRPVNLLLLPGILYFYKRRDIKNVFSLNENKHLLIFPALGILVTVIYNFKITYTQTGSLIANTYTIGRFHFYRWDHVWDNFFGFQNGILWYTPVILLCFLSIFYLRKDPRLLFLVIPVLLIIFLYSFWFYWNIVNRTLVDFSGILCILLTVVLMRNYNMRTRYRVLFLVLFLCIPFYQLKAYQLRTGILSGNYTYWKYYAKHFFTVRHVDVYPVNPARVTEQEGLFFDFENENGTDVQGEKCFEGKRAAFLDKNIEFACTKKLVIPSFFSVPGANKIKCSFWFYRTEAVKNIQLVFAIGRNDSSLVYQPFYINTSTGSNCWNYKEFGMDMPDLSPGPFWLTVYFWNPEKQSSAYVDNLKVEFLRTDARDEISAIK